MSFIIFIYSLMDLFKLQMLLDLLSLDMMTPTYTGSGLSSGLLVLRSI